MRRFRLSAVPVPRVIRPAPFSALSSLALLLLTLAASPATAQYIEPVWGPEEIVDTGAIDITSSTGSGILHAADWTPWTSLDEWHVVYAKAGDIYHAVRTSAGWTAPEPLTADAAISKDPKLAFMRDRLVVIWEDDRRGHPEIWSREWYAGAWGAELGLTDDATPSKAAVVTGWESKGFVAWEEGEVGATHIAGRGYTSTGWGAVAAVSTGSGPAIEPSVSYHTAMDYLIVAWADAREGNYEICIKERESGSWWGEQRLTDGAGSCRRPSVNAQMCCSDAMGVMSLIAFENDVTGVPEVWTAYSNLHYEWVQGPLSPDDGVASQRPQACGYPKWITVGMGGTVPRYPVTWTEDGEPGARGHLLAMIDSPGQPEWIDTLTRVGLGTSGVAAVRGGGMARVVTVWLEDREGATTLIAKPGQVIGCDGLRFEGPQCILLTPGGTQENTILCTDDCGSETPMPGVVVRLEFASSLEPLLAWDAGQPHPVTQPDTTDANGEAILAIRGGGCSATGRVSLRVNGVEVRFWTGAKSPDVNGDCEVQLDDLAYVMARVGTTDFCADLDGSGTVTTADVAIVDESLGTICSQLVAVEEPGGPEGIAGAAVPGMRITPNPTTGRVEIRIERGEEGAAGVSGEATAPRVQIFDAAGRLVREIEASARVSGAGAAAGASVIVWDGRDAGGRTVPPGLYYIRSGRGSGGVGRAVVVVR